MLLLARRWTIALVLLGRWWVLLMSTTVLVVLVLIVVLVATIRGVLAILALWGLSRMRGITWSSISSLLSVACSLAVARMLLS